MPMKADPLPLAIGKRGFDPAMLEPLVDAIEDMPEPRRRDPPKQARTGRKAPVGLDQMFAPRGHCGPILISLRLGKNASP
jgi:hypothetical protein